MKRMEALKENFQNVIRVWNFWPITIHPVNSKLRWKRRTRSAARFWLAEKMSISSANSNCFGRKLCLILIVAWYVQYIISICINMLSRAYVKKNTFDPYLNAHITGGTQYDRKRNWKISTLCFYWNAHASAYLVQSYVLLTPNSEWQRRHQYHIFFSIFSFVTQLSCNDWFAFNEAANIQV